MQSQELRQITGILSKHRAHLVKAGYITAAEVLLSPPAAVAKRTRLPAADVEDLLLKLSAIVSSTVPSLSQTVGAIIDGTIDSNPDDGEHAIATRPTTITTGDDGIDLLLDGGIPIGSLTEISGQSYVKAQLRPSSCVEDGSANPALAPDCRSSGKSNLCLQIALTTQMPPKLGGAAGGTIYISSEGMIPSSRLLSFARSTCSNLPVDDQQVAISPADLMDNVHTMKAQDVETLEQVIAFMVPAFIERMGRAAQLGAAASASNGLELPSDMPYRTELQPAPLPIKMIIVDSIAAPFRAGQALSSSANLATRAKDFGRIGDKLKQLAHVYDCAVVVVNQVTDVFDGARPAPTFLEPSDDRQAALPSRIPSPSMLNSSSPAMNGSTTRGKPAHEQYGLPTLLYNRYQAPHFSGQSPSFRSTAALGHSWSNIVNTRLMLSRTGKRKRLIEDDHDDSSQKAGYSSGERAVVVRNMSLVFSPYAPRASLEYVIIEDGVRSISMPMMRESRHKFNPQQVYTSQDNEEEHESPMASSGEQEAVSDDLGA